MTDTDDRFGVTKGAVLVTSLQAFLHDNGMPGVRLTNARGEILDLVFAHHTIEELRRQLDLAIAMALQHRPERH